MSSVLYRGDEPMFRLLGLFDLAAIPGCGQFGPRGLGIVEPFGQTWLPGALLGFGTGFAERGLR